MNGFKSPRRPRAGSVSARSLFALALASGFGLNTISAQEAEAPAAPPALLSEDTPTELLVIEEAPPAQPVAVRPAKPIASQTGKGPANLRTSRPLSAVRRPIPTASVWAEPEEAEPEAPPARPIRQVQALVPNDGLEVEPLESTEPLPPLEAAAPYEPGQVPELGEPPLLDASSLEEPGFEVSPNEPAPFLDEPDTEPAPLNNRVGNPQRVPANSRVQRTAAVESAPYNEDEVGTPAGQFSAQDAVHTVGAGESFWTISKKHYRLGRYSAALAEYNKSRIPKPDKIKPGMKVIVPPLETLEQRYERLIFGTSASVSKEEAAAPVKSGFFIDADGQPMYRVGEGDNLSTIAQDHLGRSSRWPRIVELNRESLKNPDDMKLGMVLRLPADASAK
jgi:nucleoid-associated protein YgaU